MSIGSKIDSYMINLGLTFEQIDENTWIISDEEKGLEQVAVLVAAPLVIIRVNVMDIPEQRILEFYEQLLKLNATDLIHGAYALEEKKVILVDTLEYETMDIEEFQASLDAIGLALAQHYPLLSQYRKKERS